MRKSNRKFRVIFITSTAVALGAFACASDGTNDSAMANELAGAPVWVIKGCSGFSGESKATKLCGVGSFNGSRNVTLARTAAMARGRTEIARSLSLKVDSMLKDYQSTTTGGTEFASSANDEQHFEDVGKQITDMSLTGTEIEDTWISNSGTYYTLMVLDVEKFEKSVSQMNQLSETLRMAITERASRAFAELDSN
jgi:hypothetical protein